MKTLEKDYIGDSVYIEDNGFGITLTTENGYGPSNTIIMEPAIIKAFLNYITRVEEHYKDLDNKEE